MELLPCPFCGSNDIVYNPMFSDCNNCYARCQKTDWNTRHSPWISVKDRLPKENTKVLAIWDDCIETAFYEYIDGDYWSNSEIGCDLPVTHWMPLPKLPQENTNE